MACTYVSLSTRKFPNPSRSVFSAGASLGGPLGGLLNDQFGWYAYSPNNSRMVYDGLTVSDQEDSVPFPGKSRRTLRAQAQALIRN